MYKRQARQFTARYDATLVLDESATAGGIKKIDASYSITTACLLYTSDAADDNVRV
ncbi:hypothetical protein [Dyella sp. ASV21]|uniref:hypothetical protein n=1 Tax=Dyella sp. ASV21 TaxID=2795114 RepID=UPI0018EBD6B3|nr:hypothetical protein [Dyella sp. ASV21]